MTKSDADASLMADMMRALENGEMGIHLQPKFDLRAGAVTGAEVLARWTHPVRGEVRPDAFVNVAEKSEAIRALTDWALRTTIATHKRLRGAGIEFALAVNLSGRLVADQNFIASALAILSGAEGQIYLEITETASIGDEEEALRHLQALIDAGALISIDDYGRGLSSLTSLRRIPARELKIDKVFISSLTHSPRDALIVKSTIDLAHALGMSVIAEGVEDEATLEAVRAMGCDLVQGHLTGRPMSEVEFIARFAPKRAAG